MISGILLSSSWAPPFGGFPDTHSSERGPLDRARSQPKYYISHLAGERLGIPKEELENVAEERKVWNTLLGLLPPRPNPV